jgi:hypothetical protein
MPAPRPLARPSAIHRRALALLDNAGVEGVSEHLLIAAYGFSFMQLASLVRSGLASATPTRIRAGRETIEVATLRISEKGRQALAEAKPRGAS